MKRHSVVVIVPVYNVEKYLGDSVQSVLNQSYRDIEIILVDDGSSDECSQICDKIISEYKQVSVIHKLNGGLSSARNAGLALVHDTDYVLFLDSDDQLEKTAIENMVKQAQSSGADIVIPDRYLKKEGKTGNSKIAFHFPRELHREDPVSFALDVMMENGRAWRASALLYSYNSIIASSARFPEGHIAEDISFNLQILFRANKIDIFQQPTLICLKRANSISSSFQKDFEKDIWYIDQQAKSYIEKIGMDNDIGKQKVESLLCRNIVVYLFGIMSHLNKMAYKDKVKKAQALLDAPEARQCVRFKHKTPYFEDKKTMCAISVVYWMLRHRMDAIVFRLLSML